jgi:hypothetical protein
MPIIGGVWYGDEDMRRLRQNIREYGEDCRAFVDPLRGWPPVRVVGPYSCSRCRGEVKPWSIFPAGGHSFCCCYPRREQTEAELRRIEDDQETLRNREHWGTSWLPVK